VNLGAIRDSPNRPEVPRGPQLPKPTFDAEEGAIST